MPKYRKPYIWVIVVSIVVIIIVGIALAKNSGVNDLELRSQYLSGAPVKDLQNQDQIAEKELGIEPFNPKSIKNIKSAEFTVSFSNNREKIYKQTITDSLVLSEIEKLLSEAVIINGGSGCPFREGIMTLMLEDGQQIKIAMATDSCCVYFVNGMYFDYRPAQGRKKEESGIYNNILFDYFDRIPIVTRG